MALAGARDKATLQAIEAIAKAADRTARRLSAEAGRYANGNTRDAIHASASGWSTFAAALRDML